MKTGRLEAFSDGVLAIIITIMVLGLVAPEKTDLESLLSKTPIFLSYIASFIYVGIYWNNHHHLFQITEKVNGKVLWANLHLLFWLSLIPFTTSWIGENYNESLPVATYGIVLLFCALAYIILQNTILNFHDDQFTLKQAIGGDRKGKISLVLYLIGIGLSIFLPWMAIVCYVLVAIIWIIPDSRIERNM